MSKSKIREHDNRGGNSALNEMAVGGTALALLAHLERPLTNGRTMLIRSAQVQQRRSIGQTSALSWAVHWSSIGPAAVLQRSCSGPAAALQRSCTGPALVLVWNECFCSPRCLILQRQQH